MLILREPYSRSPPPLEQGYFFRRLAPAPLSEITADRNQMGWKFPFDSSAKTYKRGPKLRHREKLSPGSPAMAVLDYVRSSGKVTGLDGPP